MGLWLVLSYVLLLVIPLPAAKNLFISSTSTVETIIFPLHAHASPDVIRDTLNDTPLVKPGTGETAFTDGAVLGASVQDFPLVTSDAQEAVRDGADADATAVYPVDSSVVLSNGELRLDREDLMIPGRGQIHFNWTRRYRSQLDYDGPLGHGWDFSYNERLMILGNGDVARSNGWGHVAVWVRNSDGSFMAPAGYFGTLSEESDGRFILRETNGFKRIYSAEGRLVSHQDRFGNALEFVYDAQSNLVLITDPYKREYTFIYQTIAGRDRLVTLRDYAGREVVYAYDAQGHLVSMRSPIVTGTSTGNDFPQGRTEQYT